MQTISIVPVGATMTAEERIARGAHSDQIEGCTPEHARAIIAQVTPYQRRFRKEHGRTLVYLADEYYLSAGIDPPGAAHYDGFAQYENGIGMTRSLIDDWRRARRGQVGQRLGTQGRLRRRWQAARRPEGRLTAGDSCATLSGELLAGVACVRNADRADARGAGR